MTRVMLFYIFVYLCVTFVCIRVCKYVYRYVYRPTLYSVQDGSMKDVPLVKA